MLRWFSWIPPLFRWLWNGLSLILLLSFAATVPILQFASLGYMLESSARVASGRPLRRCFPGAPTAGGIAACGVWLGLSWLPVWLVADFAYSAELIEPGSTYAARMRLLARSVSVLWVLWAAWALLRGGRWWHFLWPAPMGLLRNIFRRSTWRDAEDRLWNFAVSLRIPYLLKIGFYGTVGAVLWLILPATLMIIALQGEGDGPLGLIGLVGALGMVWVLQYLPFLPIQMASQNRFASVFDVRNVRHSFRKAPWAFLLALAGLVLFAIPLYLLRIESIPSQLWWILSVFFVILMFPAKLIAGWALRRSGRRQGESKRLVRWLAWIPMIAVAGVYVGFLYLAKFTLWEGAASMLLQHAFLPPVPFYLR